MTTMQVSPGIEFSPVGLENPTLRSWLPKLRRQNPHFSHEDDPAKWMGLFHGDSLLAAIAYTFYADGTVVITGILCEPTKRGRVAAVALWRVLAKLWTGRRVVFFVSTKNRKMLRALPSGSREVARMMECQL